MSDGFVNLHLPTIFRGGELPPSGVVRAHAVAGFAAIAITDHDPLAGLDALGALDGHGVRIVPGVELSIEDDPPRGLVEVHLLGYAFRPDDARLRSRLEAASQAREAQKVETVRRLAAAGYPITWQDVRRRARGNVGKPHIVAAIEAARPEVNREDLYAVMGPGGIAHVPRAQDLSLEEGVQLIRGGGGFPGRAHPGGYRRVAAMGGPFGTGAAAGGAGVGGTNPPGPSGRA